MSDNSANQDAKNWKRQYYDHLDLLDRKEKEWQATESILKKAVLRLSIAAEGQHATIDRHLQEIRSVVKKQSSIIQLESSLDQISTVLLKLGDKQPVADRKVVSALQQLLESIDFTEADKRQKNKLLKRLARANDKDSGDIAEEVQSLLSGAIERVAEAQQVPAKPGFLNSLFAPGDRDESDVVDLADDSPAEKPVETQTATASSHDTDNPSRSPAFSTDDQHANRSEDEPSAQEILIRLLEQLSVPADLHEVVDNLKQRIKSESSALSWKQLLKDVTQLINLLRNRMQEEKHEFETFLQQITGRLQEMDGFLLRENAALSEAEQAGGAFDAVVSAQVQDIHADMSTADNLNDLKDKVEKRLSVVSEHIKQYRINEQARFSNAQQNVENMQSRLQSLEQESGDLRQLILEKNKEALMDVLTEIPNRLAYEKKAAEEIARCNRFATPLSMAVWDIDLFKQVNDTHGHKVGDKVLKAVAQLLDARMRETDFIARYGGEEFVMFLPGADEGKALELADTLREKIAACNFKHHGGIVRITVSCGITSFVKGDSHESMFERADRALYAAKASGRNRCLPASSVE
jgi:diguanylate cyclase